MITLHYCIPMFRSLVRSFTTKVNQTEAITPKLPQTNSRAIFNIVKEHGPLTVQGIWEKFQELGLKSLKRKRHMKSLIRWMRERQKLRIVYYRDGHNKKFVYSTWYTKSPLNHKLLKTSSPPMSPKPPSS